MFSWIADLVASHQDDFWLNVAAGLPFALFDVAIITMLLPFTMRVWEERTWRETRLIAIDRLLEAYANPFAKMRYYHRFPLSVLHGTPSDTEDKIAANYARDLKQAAVKFSTSIDIELQTALPLLNADMTKDMMELHYLTKSYCDSVVIECESLSHFDTIGRVSEYRRLSDGIQNSYDNIHYHNIINIIYPKTAELVYKHQRLRIRYALSAKTLLNRQWHVSLGIRKGEEWLCAISAYLDRASAGLSKRNFDRKAASERFADLQIKLIQEAPVTVYIYDNIPGMLMQKKKSRLLKLSGEELYWDDVERPDLPFEANPWLAAGERPVLYR